MNEGSNTLPSPEPTPATNAQDPPPGAPTPQEVSQVAAKDTKSDDDLLLAVTSRAARWDRELRAQGKYTELAALLAFLVPGLGHIYLGRYAKGIVAFVVLVGLFGWGIGISKGECVSLSSDEESGHRYAFIAQVGAGIPVGLALLNTHQYEVKKALGMEAQKPPEVHFEDPDYVTRLPKLDEGLLYTMIAGLLNLLMIYDAFLGSPGSALRPREDTSAPAPATSATGGTATGPPEPGPPGGPPPADGSSPPPAGGV